MKKYVFSITFLLLLTGAVLIFLNKNYPEELMEVSFEEYYAPDLIYDVIKSTDVYDYVNIYDIWTSEGNAKVYTGNINIEFRNKSVDSDGTEFDSMAVIIGENVVKDNYLYYPLGEAYSSPYGEYRVAAVLSNSNDIYYSDVNILDNAKISGQTAYLVTKDVSGKEIGSEKISSVLSSKGMHFKILHCKDIHGFVKKIGLILLISICVIILMWYYKNQGVAIVSLTQKYIKVKYDVDFKQFIMQRDNLILLRNAFVYVIGLIVSIVFIMYFTVVLSNIRMPYIVNIVSPKSIWHSISSYSDMIRYYLSNGITDVSLMLLSMTSVYTVSVTSVVTVDLYMYCSNRKSKGSIKAQKN